ncbi:MAG: PCI domain-containing protein [Candidatus Lokiarchaeia archaeon]
MAYKESDVKRKIEYYSDTANLLLEEGAHDIASDFFTLAGFYSLFVRDSVSAKDFTDKALESCNRGNIEDHHYFFALSLKELISGNIDQALDYWNSTKSKYTEDEIDLVEQVLSAHKEVLPQETTEDALDTFLEVTKDAEERTSLDVFEEIALEASQEEAPTIDETPQETVTPFWAEEEPRPPIEEVPMQPETTIQEPEDEWQLISEPSESPQITQPEIEPTLEQEPEERVYPTETIRPPPETSIPSQPPLRPQIPPVTPQPSPPEVGISTPEAPITPQPVPPRTEPPAAPKIGAPPTKPPLTQVGGLNIYGRIKISDMAWRVGRTGNELTEALSNLINQGKISGYIQADEYIQTPDEGLTQLSTQSVPAPTAEAPSQFFTTVEADVTAQTREGYKRCGVCGAEIPDWTKICPKCGAKQ